MKVVLDTNIFISGIFWENNSSKIIDFWRQEKITLISSLPIIKELVKVLDDFKIRMPDEMIKQWKNVIIENAIIVYPKIKINLVKDDPDDNKFIEAAITGNAEYIISQDKHLLRIKKYKEIKILSPEQFLIKINKEKY